MSWRVSIRAAGERDLDEARRWYEEQRPGLGDEFLAAAAEALIRLETDPLRSAVYRIDGVTFPEAWETQVTVLVETPEGEVPLHYLGLRTLVRNKEMADRPKDLKDLSFLRNRR